MNRKNVGMIESRSGARFPLKTLKPIGIAGNSSRKYLDGYVSAQAAVTCTIDLAHSPGADCGLDFIAAKVSSRSNGCLVDVCGSEFRRVGTRQIAEHGLNFGANRNIVRAQLCQGSLAFGRRT